MKDMKIVLADSDKSYNIVKREHFLPSSRSLKVSEYHMEKVKRRLMIHIALNKSSNFVVKLFQWYF